MRYTTAHKIVLFSLIPVVAAFGYYAPVPSLNLALLTQEAELIVIGEVISVKNEGVSDLTVGGQPIVAYKMVATMRSDRLVKGALTAKTISFRFRMPKNSMGYANIVPGQFGMFFLRESPELELVPVSPYYPFIIASHVPPAAMETDSEQVIAEVAQVLITPQGPLDTCKRAIEVLSKVRSEAPAEVVTVALQRGVQNADMSTRLLAAAALLRRNDVSTLGIVESVLTRLPTNIDQDALTALIFAIQDGVRDPAAVPTLVHLLNAPDSQVRRAAAAALRHTSADTAINPLSKALRDNDREVRYQAVLGLAQITAQPEWGPPLDLFEKKEEHYLNYWKDWVKTQR
jgi:HEAT repeat protein